ncbi:hypothetical protein [Campylobacter geochelonis]|uniref:Uncharacterized protein n=1 Tax=Campylobacter geochelonis TaxID=1780362 RepID=A0A128EG67_9BACT|nr:hypothetical protein [Campylobacter geochelonis]QKF71751.1 hypothetical protein CGEO_1465 [Campylobacter geochelonis]CZE47587.1 Uncharacterised protein [Campylobacter geochelonis]CZE48515.1 Uncharacterised protein [Campylobacter geochelonis]CZE51170.1 Uncharacterised protein [Campylobacter geochelonis]
MKELEVHITSKSLFRSYNINLDDEFAVTFEKELNLLMDSTKSIDAKDLLKAFVQKSYESYERTKELKELIEKLENNE